MSHQLYDDLRGVGNLLSNPDRWCKGTEHQGGGQPKQRWCLIGAAKHVVYNTEARPDNVVGTFLSRSFEERLAGLGTDSLSRHQRLGQVLQAITSALPPQEQASIALYNDAPTTTHAEVMKVLGRAARGQQQEEVPVLVRLDSPQVTTSVELLRLGGR